MLLSRPILPFTSIGSPGSCMAFNSDSLIFKVMDKCFIGLGQAAGKAADHKCSFKGQMSAVYLFGEPLNQSATAAIYRLGPGYKVILLFYQKR